MNRIFLIGYMGSGKTTVGKLLADELGYGFVDMDSRMEEKYFKTVSGIFAELGEQQFRLFEQQCLHEVAEIENVVISTGGGAPCFFNNMEYMNAHGITIYLKHSPDELVQRLEFSHANKRPLLAERKGEELRQFITDGLTVREPFYSKAIYTISGNVDSTVSDICKLVSVL
jgi:shikimate kinase